MKNRPRSLILASLLLVALSLSVGFVQPAFADGFTISVGEDPDVSTFTIGITGTSSAASVVYDNCGTEGCTIIEAPKPGFSAITVPPNFYIADQGPGPNLLVSDWFEFILDFSTGDVVIGFHDTPPSSALCTVCQAVEGTGKLLTVGQITWGDPVVDTIQFQDGPPTVPAPEPASLLLLTTGLLGYGILRKARYRVVRR